MDGGLEEPGPPDRLVVLLRPDGDQAELVGDAVHLPDGQLPDAGAGTQRYVAIFGAFVGSAAASSQSYGTQVQICFTKSYIYRNSLLAICVA